MTIDTTDIMETPRPMVALMEEYPDGKVFDFHTHPRSQLLYASKGVMQVETPGGFWVVPPLRAVWLPPYTEHKMVAVKALDMLSLYFSPEYCKKTPKESCLVSVSSLFRELILEASCLPRLYPHNGPEERLVTILFDHIRQMKLRPLSLPVPDDRRLRAIYEHLTERPEDNRTLEEWGDKLGLSRKSLTRLFQKETGMSFGQWKQQLRILKSLPLLAENEQVTAIAMEMGYDNPSAFIAMFKRALGTTPGKYFAEDDNPT